MSKIKISLFAILTLILLSAAVLPAAAQKEKNKKPK